ncbi:response regulator transcription factor [Caldalkalibacillus mannanilyticus]|uniref:response regulator transcription factor n=1 Tax=Caldalkalibacillus mannanilyticus TaxID=1418 RepID=UPI000468FAF0|nr:response regulator transcription factor [Caldalkalibacillus mannanilyticus]
MDRANILLVEDDKEIARIVRDYLVHQGYGVTWASTGQEGWEDFQKCCFDLALVDLMLPEMDGLTLCKNIRLSSEVPILMISARQEDEYIVKGLNIGADDYITKPFSLTELAARISSHLRRYHWHSAQHQVTQQLRFSSGLIIDVEKKAVYLDEEEIILTSKEFSLLILLARHPERAFTKQELYEHVWQQTDTEGNNTIQVHIKSLRTKLKENMRNPKYIKTLWGTGYRFVGEPLS